jgi:dihydroflavonol-4-reductase
MKEEKVLITGASGFIGSHIIIQLLEKGYKVRGTLRNMKRAESMLEIYRKHVSFPDDQMEFAEVDLLKDEGWDEAAEGCDYLLHVASPFVLDQPKDEMVLIKPATEGTIRALKAAKNNSIKKVVLTSSVASIAFGHDESRTSFDENDWTNPDGKGVTAYVKSKYYAEKEAWDFMEKEGGDMKLSVVNPSAVLGPVLEKDYGTSAEIVQKSLSSALPGFPNVGFPIVDVRDVASMHILAMETEAANGERFVCSNDFIWFKEVGEIMRNNLPEEWAKKIPKRVMPDWLMRVVALFDKEVRGIVPDIGKKRSVDNKKARELLGWEPRSNEEAILATPNTMIELGIV